MDCNDGKCKKVRRGEGIHPMHNKTSKGKMKKISLESSLVILVGFGVIVEGILVTYAVDLFDIPQVNQLNTFQILVIQAGIAIFLASTVYIYTKKPDRIRSKRLQQQIITTFEQVSRDFSWLNTQRVATTIDEGIIQNKNLMIFHIQDLISQLPKELRDEMSIQIPDLCEKALLVPIVKKPLDQKQPIQVDYTECLTIVQEINELVKVLKEKKIFKI